MKRFALLLLGLSLSLPCSAEYVRGELLVGNKSDDTVWRLSLDDGSKLGEFATGPGPHEIAVSPDGKTVVVTDYGHQDAGNSLTVFDSVAGEVAGSIDLHRHGRPHGIRYRLDGRHLLVTTESTWRLLTVDTPMALQAHIRSIGGFDVGPGVGHMVALSQDDTTAYVSKIATGTVVRVDLTGSGATLEMPAGAGAEGIEVAPDGTVWVTNRADDTVTVHDPDSLEILATLESKGFPIRVVFTPNRKSALVTNATAGTLSVFDAQSRELELTLDLVPEGETFNDTMLGQGALPIGVIVDPARPRAYVAISGANRIAVVDTVEWKVIGYWQTGNQPDALGIVLNRD